MTASRRAIATSWTIDSRLRRLCARGGRECLCDLLEGGEQRAESRGGRLVVEREPVAPTAEDESVVDCLKYLRAVAAVGVLPRRLLVVAGHGQALVPLVLLGETGFQRLPCAERRGACRFAVLDQEVRVVRVVAQDGLLAVDDDRPRGRVLDREPRGRV